MSETQEERREAAATRRRWVTLAEVLAVAGVVIAALGLWNSWSERRADQADRAAERSDAVKSKALVRLEGTTSHGGATLTLTDADHKIDSIDLRFPTALGIAPRTGLPEPRIEAEWIAAPLLKLTDGGADTQEGKLPVLVTAIWWDADVKRTDRAIYDVVWKTEGRILRGRTLRLEGLTLDARGGSTARLDAAWAAEQPKK